MQSSNKQALAALIAITMLIFVAIKIAPWVNARGDFGGSRIEVEAKS